MRFQEFSGGLNFPISSEEIQLIEKIEISDHGHLDRNKLNSREIELARQLVSRGVLHRAQTSEQAYYTVNTLDVNWRD